jgi:hypothetical protein
MMNRDERWDYIPHPSDDQVFPSGAAASAIPEPKKRWESTPFALPRLGGRRTRIGVGVAMVAALAVVAAFFIARIGPDRPATRLLHVSYAGAASWVQALPDTEKDEQLRDWARLGLAAYLRLDAATLRDTSYDTTPVRDPGFADMLNQPTGPGRSLYDGHGVLHVLVDRRSGHESRTIGLQIDQYRTDAGQDPANVQVHRFTVDKASRTIAFRSEPAQPVAEVRAKYGYVTGRIDTLEGLNDFLRRTMHLSWMEVRQSEVWAGGWNWPGVPALPIEHEDVEVLRRSYAEGKRPGFSLDPPAKLNPPKELTVADIKALVPGVNDRLAESLTRGDDQLLEKLRAVLFFDDQKSLSELASAGLTTDRTRLWALRRIIKRTGSYQVAQYFGPLRGTKVGMTLFYTDKTAKDWVKGVGKPPGSIPTPDKPFPPSHCPREGDPSDETGRLWFAQNDAGFELGASHVSIGTQATRLNFRSNKVASGPHDAADEVEASYLSGMGLEWWDHNYQAVADYEPQYQRLEQIMRWSGALEWLSNKQRPLPQLPDEKITSNLVFESWRMGNIRGSAEHPLTFVKPPSADGMEALLQTPSKTFGICGDSWIFGGVTLGDLVQRSAGGNYAADLPAGLRRARPTDATSKVDDRTGNGFIKRVEPMKGDDVAGPEHTLSMAGGLSTVVTKAHARTAGAIGKLKLWLGAKADRRITVETRSADGTIVHRTRFNNRPIGELSAESGSNGVTITWKRGPLDRALRILEGMAAKLAGASNDQITHQISAGYKLGGRDDPRLSITKESGPPTDEMAFGFAIQPPENGTPEFYVGHLAEQGRIPEPPSPWLDVAATDSPLADYLPAGPPATDAQNIKVFAPDDTSLGVVYELDGRVTVPAGNETLGPRGPPEAEALLREIPAIKEAMRISAESPRKEHVGIRLGSDGVALVTADRVILVPNDHHWARPVLRATGPLNDPPRKPLVRIDDDVANHVDYAALAEASGPEKMPLAGVLQVKGVRDVHIDEKLRAKVILDDGALVPSALNQRISVSVRRVTPVTAVAGEPRWQPDIRVFDKQDWYRVGPDGDWFGGDQDPPNDGPGGSRGDPNDPNDPNGGPPEGLPGGIKPPPWLILLVCLDEDEDNICDYQ